MNSRKSAKTIPSTLTRLLKSKQLLKTPPSSYYAMLNHPPPPSLIRSNPVRDSADLPPSTTASRSAGQPGAHKQSLDAHHQPPTKYAATRRKPPKTSNSTRSTPLPIVYTQDQIRTQFYRDHPFEAYRDKQLTEQNLIQDEPEPTGLSWTELAQRSIKPTAEESVCTARSRLNELSADPDIHTVRSLTLRTCTHITRSPSRKRTHMACHNSELCEQNTN